MRHNYLFLIVSLISSILFMSSCSKSEDTDNSPPTVIIVSPHNNSIVTDSTVIEIEAFDNKNVAYIELYIDGQLANPNSTPYQHYLWDVTELPYMSWHLLLAKAYDGSGNIGYSLQVSVQTTQIYRPFDLSNYGVTLEEGYYKLWSDQSWTRYSRIVTIRGESYTASLSSNGTEYYYNELGYAGYNTDELPIIIFDSPVKGSIRQWDIGMSEDTGTTFTYLDVKYTISWNEILLDTSTVSLNLGDFSTCLHFATVFNLSSIDEEATYLSHSWRAIDLGTIKIRNGLGIDKILIEGNINGKQWGDPDGSPPENSGIGKNDQFTDSTQSKNKHDSRLIIESFMFGLELMQSNLGSTVK